MAKLKEMEAMRYKAYERSLLHHPDYSSVAFASNDLTTVLEFCNDWREDLTFVIVDTKTGESRQWYDWEEF